MDTSTIILICTNIAVPIIVAFVTACSQSKKYKKEIELLNAEHENKMKEQKSEFEHKIELLKLERQHQQELENQRMGNAIAENFVNKITEEVLNQPATKKMISQKTTRSFLNKKK